MKKYSDYKNSSVPWIGEIPTTWNLSQLRYVIECLDGKRVPVELSLRADMQGNIPYWGAGNIVDYVDKALFDEELVLLGEDGAPFFDHTRPVAFHITEPIWANNHIHVLRIKENADPKYIVYVLNAVDYGMALCPFHNDRHPSLYVSDDHYHCFACEEHGDVIDLTAKLFDLRLYDAARKLASDFHLAPDKPLPEAIRRKKKHKTKAQQLRENEQLCFSVLNKYRRLLLDWKKRYAPQAPEAVLDERFVEACHRLPWAEYQLDILLQGDSYERGEVVSELTADGYIRKLQARLRKERYHEQPCLDR